ncbi:MAG TPA: hypothetical protein VLT82_08060 [Myxococcaceae bacterium]|nr:hypothetical protein [Myxococcaceae bacterium]
MMIQIDRTEFRSWARVRCAVACFLCLMGFPFLFLVLGNLLPADMVGVPRV